MNILRIDGSARVNGSVTRQLADQLISQLREQNGNTQITQRELTDALPQITEGWVNANFTDPLDRSDEQKTILAQSDELVAELRDADVIVIAVPVYNFGIPAAVKAWVDLICRARETFRYTENGPEGLVSDRTVYVVTASGGTQIGGDMDFATPYLRHIFGFIGITDVRVIEAGQLTAAAEPAIARAQAQIIEAVSKAA